MGNPQDIQAGGGGVSGLPAISTLARDDTEPSWALRVQMDPFTEGAWATLRQRAGVSVADALVGSGFVNDDSVQVRFNGVSIPPDKRHMVRPKENRVVSAEPTPGGPGAFLAAAIIHAGQLTGLSAFAVAVLGSIIDYKLGQRDRNGGPAPRRGRVDATGSNHAQKGDTVPIIAGYIKFVPPLAMQPSSEYIGDSDTDQYFKTAVFWGHAPMHVQDIHFGSGDGDNAAKTEAQIIDSDDEWARHDFDGKGTVLVDRVDKENTIFTPTPEGYVWDSNPQAERLSVEVHHARRYEHYISYYANGWDKANYISSFVRGTLNWVVTIEHRIKPLRPGDSEAWTLAHTINLGTGHQPRDAGPIKLLMDGGEDPSNRGERLSLPGGRTTRQMRIRGTLTKSIGSPPANALDVRAPHESSELTIRRIAAFTDDAPVSRAGLAVSAWKIRLDSSEGRVVREISARGGQKVFKYDKARREWPADTPRNRRSAGRFGWSTNPADWFLAYICSTDFNQFPKPRSLVDLESLADWWEFCDERGLKWSYRNHAGRSLNDLLNDLCAAGLAQPVLTGQMGVVIDRAVPRSTWLFTPAVTRNFKLQADKVQVPHAYRVTYEDEASDWDEQTRIVYRDGYNLDGSGAGNQRAKHIDDLTLTGVTSREQVYILARHRLAALVHRPHTVSFDVDYAAMAVELGDRVTLAHDGALVGQAWGRVESVNNESSGPVAGPPQYAAWPAPGAFSSRAPTLDDFAALAAPTETTIGRFEAGSADAPLNWRYDGAYATWVVGNTQHVIAAFGDNSAAWRTRTRADSNAAWSSAAWTPWTRATTSGSDPYFTDDANRVSGDSRPPALVQFGVTANLPAVIKPRSHVTTDRTFAILEDLPEGSPTSLQRVHQAYWGPRTWERRVTRSAGQRGAVLELNDVVTFEAARTYKIVVGLENGENVVLAATPPANLPNGVGSTRLVRVPRASGVQEGDQFTFGEGTADYKVAAIEPQAEGRAKLTLVNYGGDAVFNSAATIPPFTPIIHRPVSPTLTGPLPPIIDESAIVSDEDALPIDLKGTPVPTILVPFALQDDDPANPRITSADHVILTATPVGGTGLTPPRAEAQASEGRAYLYPVTAGVTYSIKAIAFDRDAGFSVPATARHTAVGLAARPPNVIDFDMEVAGDGTNFTWRLPPDLPRDVVAAELRYASQTDVENWDETSVVARVSIENTAKTLPTINGTYAIKLVDSVGSYSETAVFRRMKLANPPVPLNVEAERAEHSAWTGTKTNVAVRNGTLELERTVVAARAARKLGNVADPATPDFDTIGEADYIGSRAEARRFATRGFYEGGVLDLSAVYDVVLDVDRKVTPPVNLSQLLKDIPEDGGWARLKTMSGTSGDDATQVRVQVRTATEDPIADPGKWSGWGDVTRQRVTARWVQAQIVMETTDTNISPVIEEMTLKVHAVQEVLRGSATSAQQDKEVTFSPAFEDDDVEVILQQGNDAAAGEKAVLVSKSKSKFSFKVVNASGTRVTGRSVSWLAVGWGRRSD